MEKNGMNLLANPIKFTFCNYITPQLKLRTYMIEASFETQCRLLELIHMVEHEMINQQMLMANNLCQGILINLLLYFSLNPVHV